MLKTYVCIAIWFFPDTGIFEKIKCFLQNAKDNALKKHSVRAPHEIHAFSFAEIEALTLRKKLDIFFKTISGATSTIDGSRRSQARAPSNNFNLMQFSGKFGQNNSLAPHFLLGNTGSAIEYLCFRL